MAGETSTDERDMSDALCDYREHEQLHKDSAYFDPCNVKDIAAAGLPDNALLKISNYM